MVAGITSRSLTYPVVVVQRTQPEEHVLVQVPLIAVIDVRYARRLSKAGLFDQSFSFIVFSFFPLVIRQDCQIFITGDPFKLVLFYVLLMQSRHCTQAHVL